MSDFALDVLTGLSAGRKSIPTKYIYDDEGSALFSRIMELPEYYPSRCEAEILEGRAADLSRVMEKAGPFQLVELGAGDGRKTGILLEAFRRARLEFRYVPIDISPSAVEHLTHEVRKRWHVPCKGLVSDYFDAFKRLDRAGGGTKLVLFLGGSLGNFTPEEARVFLRKLWNGLSHGDHVLIGFDLKKDVDLLVRAYNDAEGLTRRFNLNVLERVNRELGGRFDLSKFAHYGPYNATAGAMESYLISLEAQDVPVEGLAKTFRFKPHEPIFLECSYKFLPEDVLALAQETGFANVDGYFDSRGWFLDALWRVEKRG